MRGALCLALPGVRRARHAMPHWRRSSVPPGARGGQCACGTCAPCANEAQACRGRPQRRLHISEGKTGRLGGWQAHPQGWLAGTLHRNDEERAGPGADARVGTNGAARRGICAAPSVDGTRGLAQTGKKGASVGNGCATAPAIPQSSQGLWAVRGRRVCVGGRCCKRWCGGRYAATKSATACSTSACCRILRWPSPSVASSVAPAMWSR